MSVKYTGSYNYDLHQPILEYTWLTEDEARRIYAVERNRTLHVVDDRTLDGTLQPRFVIEVGTTPQPRLRVRHLNDLGTITRSFVFRPEEGRLWLDEVIQWDYPDESEQYDFLDSTMIVSARPNPDGEGSVTINDKQAGERTTLRMRDVPVDRYWADVPEFGNWTPLVDATRDAPTTVG